MHLKKKALTDYDLFYFPPIYFHMHENSSISEQSVYWKYFVEYKGVFLCSEQFVYYALEQSVILKKSEI